MSLRIVIKPWWWLSLVFWLVSPAGAANGRVVVETAYLSRGVYIPATVEIPSVAAQQAVPLVIMAHGHGGNREEAGAFGWMARELSAMGIASVRMDFAGCGDNPDPFTENNLSTMLEDIQAARRFALEELPIDPTRIGVLGYSMGARLAVLANGKEPFTAMALWSAVGLNGRAGMLKFLGGESAWQQLYGRAQETGDVAFITPWGQQQLLGLRWFQDMESSRPESVIGGYRGSLLLVHGGADETVTPGNSKALLSAATAVASVDLFMVEGAGHGLGFYDGNQEIAGLVIDRTVRFFGQQLAGGSEPLSGGR